MKITTDYAIRLLLCLGEHAAKRTAEELAVQMAVPKPTVVKIMKRFKSRGWVDSQEGLRGGYTLIVPLARISLFDLFNAMGETAWTTNWHRSDRRCPHLTATDCSVRNAYIRLQGVMEGILHSLTLDKVLEGDLRTLDAVHAAILSTA